MTQVLSKPQGAPFGALEIRRIRPVLGSHPLNDQTNNSVNGPAGPIGARRGGECAVAVAGSLVFLLCTKKWHYRSYNCIYSISVPFRDLKSAADLPPILQCDNYLQG
jgi:hypothetical protein